MIETVISHPEFLGWVAGATNLSSSIPQILANVADRKKAAEQSLARNFLQAAGNLLWLVYAIKIDAEAMKVFATLGFLLAGWLVIQVIRAKETSSKFDAH